MEIKNILSIKLLLDCNRVIEIECTNEQLCNIGEPLHKKLKFSIEIVGNGHLFILGLSEANYRLYKIDKDNTCSLLNTYESIGVKADNAYAVKKNGLWGFINNDGKEIITPRYKDYVPFKDGLALVKSRNGKWGVINKENKIIVPFKSPSLFRYFYGNYVKGLDVYDENEKLVYKGKPYQKLYYLGSGHILIKNKNEKEYNILKLSEN